MKILRFLLAILSLSPLHVLADVRISEIMYDLEGSDSGYEWIEIHNTGTDTVNIESWYFRENEVNHGLTAQGATELAAGERMLVVQNVQQFQDKYGTNLNLLKSSFSLSNTGEELALADENREVVFSYTYNSETGAAGDGNSLQYLGTTWAAGEPSPGEANNHNAVNPGDDNEEENSSTDDGQGGSTKVNKSDQVITEREEDTESYDAYINFPKYLSVHNPVRFRIGVFHNYDGKRIHKKGGRYYVNFGDGKSLYSKERIDTEHRYQIPGDYLVQLSYYSSEHEYRADMDPDVVYEKVIRIHDSDIEIQGHDGYGGLTIANTGPHNIDMSHWKLNYPNDAYTFPKNTILLAKQQLNLSHADLGVVVHSANVHDFYLTNDQGRYVHGNPYTVATPESQAITKEQSVDDIVLGENTSFLDDYRARNSLKQSIDIPESSREVQGEEKKGYRLPLTLLAAALVTLTVMRYLIFMRKREVIDAISAEKRHS
jgi:P pilus assembly chaperone PapD